MARKRMIHPDFWRDEKLGECSFFVRLLFIGLWTFADDNGVGRANPILLKSDAFPYDVETLKPADIQHGLETLAAHHFIVLYERDGQKYYFVQNFQKHQTINKPTPSSLPTPLPEDYGSTTVVLPTEENIREENISEVRREEKRITRARFTPPTLEEVTAYVQERRSQVDPQGFIDYYASKGWLVGKTPMKDWKAACRNAEGWERWIRNAPRENKSFAQIAEEMERGL